MLIRARKDRQRRCGTLANDGRPACRTRAARRVIAVEYFGVDKFRSIPPARRPQASLLLAELANPDRRLGAVVVGEPQRAFYGNQFGNTFPLFEPYHVPLWVPEVGGPIDPANEAHEMIKSTFGSLSKGKRNRIKTGSAPQRPRSWSALAIRKRLRPYEFANVGMSG